MMNTTLIRLARRRGIVALGLAAVMLASGGCSKVYWRPDLGGALRLAAKRDQIVVVAYWSSFNKDCARMDDFVFRDSDVAKAMKNTINVKLPAWRNKRFGEDYGLTGPPAFVIFGPDGRVLRIQQGYMNDGRMRGMIESARLSK